MLPYLREGEANSKKYIVQFLGLNMGEDWSDGEFSACENLSSARLPCLSQRFGRTLEAEYEAPEAIHTKAGLIVIDGEDVLFNGSKVGSVSVGRKQIATVGNIVVIFPDKVYYRVDTAEFGNMEESITVKDVTFTDSTITVDNAGFKFRVGDAVSITGCFTFPENNKTIIVREVADDTLTFYQNSFTEGFEEGTVTIAREVPDLDFICESNYRLWGVKGNTIHGSAYADPLNFSVFDGLAGDSYYIDVGSDGEWTGCIPYSSHICFFKENTLHKLYGSKPSNYQVLTSQVYGVQAGSERSMCVVNETLYYKGVNGVYAYTGGIPELVSPKFGMVRYSDACAASDGDRYYISMRHGNEWSLMTYDVLRNLWLKEDNAHCVDMALYEGHVYLLLADGGLWKIVEDEDIGDLPWSATFCPFNEVMNERKGYSKFHLRLEMAAGSWLTVEMRCDNEPRWQRIFTTHNKKACTLSVPVLPMRSDKVEIKISGRGKCLLRTFIREFFTGSDV